MNPLHSAVFIYSGRTEAVVKNFVARRSVATEELLMSGLHCVLARSYARATTVGNENN